MISLILHLRSALMPLFAENADILIESTDTVKVNIKSVGKAESIENTEEPKETLEVTIKPIKPEVTATATPDAGEEEEKEKENEKEKQKEKEKDEQQEP